MQPKLKYLIQLLVITAIAGGYYFVSERNWPEADHLDFERRYFAPEFDLVNVSNESENITLASFKGKPLVVSFWASWCKVCRQDIGNVLEVEQFAKERGFQVLHLASYDDVSSVKQSDAFKKYVYTTALDKDGLIAQKFKVQGLPSTIVIDKEGVIKRKIDGPLNAGRINEIMKLIETLNTNS